MHISLPSLLLLGGALLSLGSVAEASGLPKAGEKRSGATWTPSPLPKRNSRSAGAQPLGATVIKPNDKLMTRLAKTRNDLEGAFVNMYMPSLEPVGEARGSEWLRQDYEDMCNIIMETLLDPSLKESLGAMVQIGSMHQELSIHASQGLYGESQKSFSDFLNTDLREFMSAMKAWSERVRTEDAVADAVVALSNDEEARDTIVSLLSRIMISKGRLSPESASFDDSQEIEAQLVTALSALDAQSAKVIAEIFGNISRALLPGRTASGSTEGKLYEALSRAVVRFE